MIPEVPEPSLQVPSALQVMEELKRDSVEKRMFRNKSVAPKLRRKRKKLSKSPFSFDTS